MQIAQSWRRRAGRTFFEGLEVDKARPMLVHEGAEGQTIGPTGGKVANVLPRIPRRRSLAPVFSCKNKIINNQTNQYHLSMLDTNKQSVYQSRRASWPRTVAMVEGAAGGCGLGENKILI